MESPIREAILTAVEQNGGRIGNQNLIQQVIRAGEAAGHTFSEQTIQAVREQLIHEGVLGRGRGRGRFFPMIHATPTWYSAMNQT